MIKIQEKIEKHENDHCVKEAAVVVTKEDFISCGSSVMPATSTDVA
jgi:hypothetical protein